MNDNKRKKIDEQFLREAARKHLELAKSGKLREYIALRHGVIQVTLKKAEAAKTDMDVGEEPHNNGE